MNAFTNIDFGELVPGLSSLTAEGTTQANAYILTKKVNVFSSVPSGSGAVLPSSYSPGAQIWVLNRDPANTLLLYPPLGDRIEANAVNTPLSVVAAADFVVVSFDPPLSKSPRTWYLSSFFENGAFVPTTGGTMTGQLIINNASGTSLDARHNALIGGTLAVTGTSAFSDLGTFSKASGTGLAVTANATIGGTLGITGAVTAASTITLSTASRIISGAGLNQEIQTGGAGTSWSIGNNGAALGAAVVAATNTGGNTLTGTSGNLVTIGNRLMSNFYLTPGNSFTLAGAGTLSPVIIQANYLGSTTAIGASAYQFNIPSDTLNANTGGFTMISNTMNVATGARGGRTAMTNYLSLINGAITGDTSSQQYTPTNSWLTASVNAGGSDTGSGSRGSAYGFNPQVVLGSGATNWTVANAGGEADVAIQAGATVRDAIMGSWVLLGSHAVAGARANYGLLLAAQVGAAATIQHGLTIGGEDGPFPMASGGALVDTVRQINQASLARAGVFPPQLLTYGINVSNINFSQQSGYSFLAPGVSADGSGQMIMAQGLALARNGTNYTIDVPNTFAVNSIAVNVAGVPIVVTGSSLNNYYPGDIVYGTGTPSPGQYKITHTKVLSAVVTTGGTGGTPGAVTITGTTGTGTKFQATGTISAGGILTGALVVSVAGDYTVNPTNLNAEPVTGGGLSGTTIAIGVGALTVTVLVPDVFVANTTAITPTGGSGAGLTLTGTNQVRAGMSIMPTAGGLLGFYGTAPIAKQTGVAVTAAGIHAACVAIGLFAA